MKGKIVILSAPSGTGKSSIIRHLLRNRPDLCLGFSISATSRSPREGELNGKDYYFISPEEFRERIKKGEFVEWEEVYKDTFYGTLESEIERVAGKGDTLIMDIDVKGGMNVKKRFGKNAIAIFIMPPSKEELERRLTSRGTDSDEAIRRRLEKADFELNFAKDFDFTVVNDDLHSAAGKVADLIENFRPEEKLSER